MWNKKNFTVNFFVNSRKPIFNSAQGIKMKYLLKSILAGLLVFSLLPGHAQQSGDYEYNSEFIWGVTKATNSGLIGGLILKYGRSIKERQFESYGLELVNIKHAQEERHYAQTGNTFIWGKLNYLYSARLQYGREWVLFKKAPQQGVQINGILSGGPSIGIEAPYYVDVLTQPSTDYNTGKEPFNPDKHNYASIMGTGNIFQGIEKSKIVPGINAKAALSFEFGTFKSNVVGFEAGVMMEAFTRKIDIMAFVDNKSIYPNAFFTLFYGSRR